jgi:hypothetical protein
MEKKEFSPEKMTIALGLIDAWKNTVYAEIDLQWQGLISLYEVKADFDFTIGVFDTVLKHADIDRDSIELMKKEFRAKVMEMIYKRGIDYDSFMNAKPE